MQNAKAVKSYKDIDYTLKKSERKTTSIYIERDGTVSVLAPEPFDQQKIEQIIEKKRSWIYRNLAEWEDLNRTRIQRQYVNGESFLYLGRSYRLHIVANQEEPLVFKNGQFQLSKKSVQDAPELFKQFYKAKLLKKIEERSAGYTAKMAKQPKGFRVMELKNRWGSCSSQGVLNFHWKCAMLPLSVLDYVIVHELAHLQYLNHTPAFWRVVEKVIPGYEEQKTWLKFNGASMSL